jgi:hypothetical protein
VQAVEAGRSEVNGWAFNQTGPRSLLGYPYLYEDPWPVPVVDQIEPLAAKHAARWAAWGDRTVWGAAGRRRRPDQPGVGIPGPADQAQPVWQTDLLGAGAPRRRQLAYGGVVEDWATLCLACPVTTTQGTRDAVAALEAAIEGGPALRGDRPEREWSCPCMS